MKSVDDGITRRYRHNDLLRTVSDFSPTLILHLRSTTTQKLQGILLSKIHY